MPSASRSRRASRTSRSSPPRTRTPSRRDSKLSGSSSTKRLAPSSTDTFACCWRGPGPSTSRRSGSRPRSRPGMSSTAWRPFRGCTTAPRRGSWTSARAAGFRVCPSPRRCRTPASPSSSRSARRRAFLRTVVDATGIAGRVTVVHARAEAVAADASRRETWSVVTARAVATTADLVELAFPLLEPGGVLVAWKRGDLDAELAHARRAVDALGGGIDRGASTPRSRGCRGIGS